MVYHYTYWASRYPSKDSTFFVKTILQKKTTKFVLEHPIYALKNQTIFHATCFNDNSEIAQLLLKSMREYQDVIDSGSIHIFENSLVNLNTREMNYFSRKVRKYISEYKTKVRRYAQNVFHNFLHPSTKVANKNYRYLGLNTFETQDVEGNTVMHLAVSNGSIGCIKLYVEHFADLMKENGDYYKPLELIYDRKTRNFFYSYFAKLKQ